MDNQEKLKNYILGQIQAGVHPDEIAQQLRTSGWDEPTIQGAFRAMQSSMAPAPPMVPANPVESGQQPSDSANTGQIQTSQPAGIFNAPQAVHYEPTGKKRGRLKTSWLLLKQSLKILKNNKQLVRYPFMGGLISTLITIIFAIIFFVSGDTFMYQVVNEVGNETYNFTAFGYAVSFVYYVIAFFIIFMYNAGLAAHVLDIFHGKSLDYKHYMGIAWSKRGTIFIYSLISATVGLILNAIEQRSRLLGYIVSRILGALWTLANLFTIPIIVESDASAPNAIKQSSQLFLSRWGENIGARVTFGGISALLYLLIMIPLTIIMVMIGIALGPVGIILMIAVLLISIILFATVVNAASNILSTALYFYAKYQQIPAAYDPELLNAVFIPKKARRGLFGKKTA